MLIHLDNRSLLKVSGSDAESFLQAQLSNNIRFFSFFDMFKKISLHTFPNHSKLLFLVPLRFQMPWYDPIRSRINKIILFI